MIRKTLPSGNLFAVIIVRHLIEDDEYLEIRAPVATDIGRFAKHIFKIVVGILKIVLHDEFHCDSCDSLSSVFHGNVDSLCYVSAFDTCLLVVRIALRPYIVIGAEPFCNILGDSSVQRLQFLVASRRSLIEIGFKRA